MVRTVTVVVLLAGLAACTGEGSSPEPEVEVVLMTGANTEAFDRCKEPTPKALAKGGDLAAEVTFQRRTELELAFTVDRWLTDDEGDRLVIQGGDASTSYFVDTLVGIETPGPEKGDRFLVVAERGYADACLTRPLTTKRVATYEKAFNRR